MGSLYVSFLESPRRLSVSTSTGSGLPASWDEGGDGSPAAEMSVAISDPIAALALAPNSFDLPLGPADAFLLAGFRAADLIGVAASGTNVLGFAFGLPMVIVALR